MEMLDGWLLETLQGVLSPRSLRFLHEHVLHPHAPIQILKRRAVTVSQKTVNIMWPFIESATYRLVDALQNSSNIVILGFFLVVLIVAMQILRWMQRVMIFWTRLLFRMVFWAGVVALAAVLYDRGPEAVIKDAIVIISQIAAYALGLKDFFLKEYERYDQQSKRAGATAVGKAGW